MFSLSLLFILKRKGGLSQSNRNKLALIFWWFNWGGIYQPTHPGVHKPKNSEVWETTGSRLSYFPKGNTNQSYEWRGHEQNHIVDWVVSPEFIYWNPSPLCEVISVKATSNMSGVFIREGRGAWDACTQRKGHVRTQKGAVCKPRSDASRETNLPTPWSWTLSLQNCEKISCCCLSHLVCGILLWQPENTTPRHRHNISNKNQCSLLLSKTGPRGHLLWAAYSLKLFAKQPSPF